MEETTSQANDVPVAAPTVTTAIAMITIAPTPTPDVDEDGYSIQPKERLWETPPVKKGSGPFETVRMLYGKIYTIDKFSCSSLQKFFTRTRTVIRITMNMNGKFTLKLNR